MNENWVSIDSYINHLTIVTITYYAYLFFVLLCINREVESEKLLTDRNLPRRSASNRSGHSGAQNSSVRHCVSGGLCRFDRKPRVAIHTKLR